MTEERFASVDLATSGSLLVQLEGSGVTKAVVVAYLSEAPILWSARRLLPDAVTGAPYRIPDAMHTDGVWRWHESLTYHVREHDARVPDELLQHMAAGSFRLPEGTGGPSGAKPRVA